MGEPITIKTGGSDWSSIPRWTRFWYRVSNLLGYLQQWIFHRVIKEPVWRSSDGTVRLISQLDDDHLVNISRMLARRDGQPATKLLISIEISQRGLEGRVNWQSGRPSWAR